MIDYTRATRKMKNKANTNHFLVKNVVGEWKTGSSMREVATGIAIGGESTEKMPIDLRVRLDEQYSENIIRAVGESSQKE